MRFCAPLLKCRVRPSVRTHAGAVEVMELELETSAQLAALSREQGVTLFMTMLAAFKVMLHRYSGQEEIVVGSPIANRNRIETEMLIGFFANMLVLRTNLAGDPTVKTLLSRIKETTLGA